jgi:hypothetical protein
VSVENIANWATIVGCILEVILFGFVLFEFKYLRHEAQATQDREIGRKLNYMCCKICRFYKEKMEECYNNNKQEFINFFNNVDEEKDIMDIMKTELVKKISKQVNEEYHISDKFVEFLFRWLLKKDDARYYRGDPMMFVNHILKGRMQICDNYQGISPVDILLACKVLGGDKEIEKIHNKIFEKCLLS